LALSHLEVCLTAISTIGVNLIVSVLNI